MATHDVTAVQWLDIELFSVVAYHDSVDAGVEGRGILRRVAKLAPLIFSDAA